VVRLLPGHAFFIPYGTQKVMNMLISRMAVFSSLAFLFVSGTLFAQPGSTLLKWSKEGNSFFRVSAGNIVQVDISGQETVTVSSDQLRPPGEGRPLAVRDFSFSPDGRKVLIYTNAKRVWRYDTRGDYWVLDRVTRELARLGKDRPAASLQFAKFSPDASKVAYSSEHNVYVEDLAT